MTGITLSISQGGEGCFDPTLAAFGGVSSAFRCSTAGLNRRCHNLITNKTDDQLRVILFPYQLTLSGRPATCLVRGKIMLTPGLGLSLEVSKRPDCHCFESVITRDDHNAAYIVLMLLLQGLRSCDKARDDTQRLLYNSTKTPTPVSKGDNVSSNLRHSSYRLAVGLWSSMCRHPSVRGGRLGGQTKSSI